MCLSTGDQIRTGSVSNVVVFKTTLFLLFQHARKYLINHSRPITLFHVPKPCPFIKLPPVGVEPTESRFLAVCICLFCYEGIIGKLGLEPRLTAPNAKKYC